MVFTAFAAADMYGKKCNIEVGFPVRPSAAELEKEVERVLKMEALVKRPEGAELQKVEVGRIQVLDDANGVWQELSDDVLPDYCQIYVVQPNITDVVGPIPYPTPPSVPHVQQAPVAPVAPAPTPAPVVSVAPVTLTLPSPAALPVPRELPTMPRNTHVFESLRPLSSGPSIVREEYLRDASRTLLALDSHRVTMRQESTNYTSKEDAGPYRLMHPRATENLAIAAPFAMPRVVLTMPPPGAELPVPVAAPTPALAFAHAPAPVSVAAVPVPVHVPAPTPVSVMAAPAPSVTSLPTAMMAPPPPSGSSMSPPLLGKIPAAKPPYRSLPSPILSA